MNQRGLDFLLTFIRDNRYPDHIKILKHTIKYNTKLKFEGDYENVK